MRKKDVFRSTVARKREAELEGIFRELTDVNGQMLVRDLVFTATKETALDNRLPNIVVYWHDAAFVPALRVAGTNIVAQPVAIKAGQHALDGFCLINSKQKLNTDEPILAEEMGHLLARLAGG